MRTVLYIVRHGETDWNQQGKIQGHLDIPLNANGKHQAGLVAERLRGIEIDSIYSSDLSRAKETALIIAGVLNISNLESCRHLRERSFGAFEGSDITSLLKTNPNYESNWHDEGEIESLHSVQKRAISRVTELMIEARGKNILVVSHGVLIGTFLHYLANEEEGTNLTIVNNTSISSFEYDHPSWKVNALNDDKHLY
ncbi:histidine phosphatase family protein [Metabacillus herbersteinensis]|uniref:Histidine phosphatase family protein n=1 Tax=Metabacillus herbersteinensis TaxID=283816 RepID=A0ABV6GL09_9BACI